MRILLIVCSLCCTIFITPILGQSNEKVDSLLNLYNNAKIIDTVKIKVLHQLYNNYLYNDITKSNIYIQEALDLAKKIEHAPLIAKSIFLYGNIFYLSDLSDSATYYYEQARDYAIEMKDTTLWCDANHNIANVANNLGDYTKGIQLLENNLLIYKKLYTSSHDDIGKTYQLLCTINRLQGHFQLALKNGLNASRIFKQTKNEIGQADVLYAIAPIEEDLQNFQKAIDYTQEALTIYEQHNDIYFQMLATQNLGLFHIKLLNYEEAKNYLNKSAELAAQTSDKLIEANTITQLGIIHQKTGNFQQAIKDIIEGLRQFQLIKDKGKITYARITLASLYNEVKTPNKAILHLNKAILLADSIESQFFLKEAYLERSKSYEALNNNLQALKDYKTYQTIHDTLLNQSKLQQIEELRILHDIDKKEQSIELQKNKITLLEKEASLSRLQKWLLGLGLGLSFIILGLGYYAFQQKLKRKQQQNEQQKLLYEKELTFKKRELTAHALHLAKKNEVLSNLKQKAISLNAIEKESRGYQKLINTIDFDLKDEDNWENFKKYFEQVHANFNTIVLNKYPKVTSNELRLMSLLKMGLSSKEIANILNISAEGVKKARQRLRKKLGMQSSDSLENLIMEI